MNTNRFKLTLCEALPDGFSLVFFSFWNFTLAFLLVLTQNTFTEFVIGQLRPTQ